MSYIYGAFVGTRWALTYNRRTAEKFTRKHKGYVVRNRYNRGDMWDAPTFEHVGELIADFRAKPDNG